ncbi:MAG: endolytic transglycosylase MltG [Candidatus Spechtbacterales bacterium]
MKVLKYFILSILALNLMTLGLFGMFAYDISKAHRIDAVVEVEQGMGLQDIAQVLKKENAIKNSTSFTLYALIEGKASSLKAGVYKFNSDLSVKDIAQRMEEGATHQFVRVTIPEGFRKEQIAARLESEGAIEDGEEFLNFVNMSTSKTVDLYDGVGFLNNIEADSLEGFLFPDTYEFSINSSPQVVLGRFLNNFAVKTEDLNIDYDTIIIASLLEREVQTEEDMKLVSGVIRNRLNIGMALQVDATLAYITGKDTPQLTNADKLIDSPYNTYLYRGLPPAPIANPGRQTIEAALNPTPNNYFYYLSDLEGNTHFAETLDMHNENKVRYLR